MKKAMAMVLCLTVSFSPSFAQTSSYQLNADLAEKIVQGCKTHSLNNSQSHAIAVYDKGGNLVAALRMDGNGPGIMAFSEEKAKAVSSWGFATSGMEQAVKETPGFGNAPYVVTVPGGVPIYTLDGRSFLGGVGVSGQAPAVDAACAVAGIKAAGLSSERKRN